MKYRNVALGTRIQLSQIDERVLIWYFFYRTLKDKIMTIVKDVISNLKKGSSFFKSGLFSFLLGVLAVIFLIISAIKENLFSANFIIFTFWTVVATMVYCLIVMLFGKK